MSHAFCVTLSFDCYRKPVLVNVFDLWLIGERCCQGYSAVLAQGAIDDDCINLGQIQ